jgi:hypothetical protein
VQHWAVAAMHATAPQQVNDVGGPGAQNAVGAPGQHCWDGAGAQEVPPQQTGKVVGAQNGVGPVVQQFCPAGQAGMQVPLAAAAGVGATMVFSRAPEVAVAAAVSAARLSTSRLECSPSAASNSEASGPERQCASCSSLS